MKLQPPAATLSTRWAKSGISARAVEAAPVTPSFNITGISRDQGTGNITVSWQSTPGKAYSIQYSKQLSSFPADLGVTLPAAAAPATTTSHTFPNPGANEPRMFYRVLQLQ